MKRVLWFILLLLWMPLVFLAVGMVALTEIAWMLAGDYDEEPEGSAAQ